jgi:hypothetical protein
MTHHLTNRNLVNEDGISFKYMDKSARVYWINGNTYPVLTIKTGMDLITEIIFSHRYAMKFLQMH